MGTKPKRGRACDFCGKPGATVRVGWNHPFTEYLHFHPDCKALHYMAAEEMGKQVAVKLGLEPAEDDWLSRRAAEAIEEARHARAVEEDQKRQMNLFT